jgi:integrase
MTSATEFRTWCDAAGLPAKCSAHGLRKVAAIRAALTGCTAPQIMALGGWKSIKEVQRYIAAAEQINLARGYEANCA